VPNFIYFRRHRIDKTNKSKNCFHRSIPSKRNK
jgi:hypothetical protein